MQTTADRILSFYSSLTISSNLPEGVEVMNPYKDKLTFQLCSDFYRKYYSDNHSRTMLLGINPGRFGGGITGIPFTDPVKLEKICGIPNNLPRKTELSADFIYRMIDVYGGPQKFYSHFYIGAISPLGFTKDGRNLNYYDIKELGTAVYPFIISSLKSQISLGMNKEICFCLGEGQNFKFLTALNRDLSLFRNVIPLSHPRYIMQYKRKRINEYVDDYVEKLLKV